MTTKHTYPTVMLIEMGGITNLIKHVLNDISKNRIITLDVAYKIALGILRSDLSTRCYWMSVSDLHMTEQERENILVSIDELTIEYVNYLIEYGHLAFHAIEQAITELLDSYLEKHTWGVWSITPHFNYSVYLINDGDYRIIQWVQHQQQIDSQFARTISPECLGLNV